MNLFLVKFCTKKAPYFEKESQNNKILFVEHHKDITKAIIYQAPAMIKTLQKKKVFISSKLLRSVNDLFKDKETIKPNYSQSVQSSEEIVFLNNVYQNGTILQQTFFNSAVVYKGSLYVPATEMGRHIGRNGWKINLLRAELKLGAVRGCAMLEDGESSLHLRGLIHPEHVAKVIWNKKTGRQFFLPKKNTEVLIESYMKKEVAV